MKKHKQQFALKYQHHGYYFFLLHLLKLQNDDSNNIHNKRKIINMSKETETEILYRIENTKTTILSSTKILLEAITTSNKQRYIQLKTEISKLSGQIQELNKNLTEFTDLLKPKDNGKEETRGN